MDPGVSSEIEVSLLNTGGADIHSPIVDVVGDSYVTILSSSFTNAYPLEAYVDTYDGYEGVGTLLSKFGVQDLDDLVLIISKERYEDYISPLIENIPNIELTTRPREGDLIYFPLGDRLFEIKYVEHEKPFYQLQKQ